MKRSSSCANSILLGSCGYSCHAEHDKNNAFRLALSIVLKGLEMKSLPKELHTKKHEEALAILNECQQSVKKLLTDHKDMLAEIAKLLRERETIDGYEIIKMVAKPL